MEKNFADGQKKVTIVTDSVAQVPEKLANQLDISVIPFSVQINNQRFLDGVDLSPRQLYQRMRTEKIVPTTSAPSIGEYLAAFRSRLHAGSQAILHVALASKLSSAYNNACEAAKQACLEFPGSAIEVFDSRHVTISQGFIAIAAAKAAAEGKPLLEVLDVARKASDRCGFAATLSSLEYLARGGRIGKAAYLLGSVVDIKPILTVNDGIVTPVKIVRSNKHALHSIVDFVVQKSDGCRRLSIAIMSADDAEGASALKELAMQKMQPDELIEVEFTPVMGVHAGPGLIGMAYYFE